MNIFVLCTGRCGSTTFARACQHIENYSVGHESRVSCVTDGRFNYPDNHIEVDNRLTWFLGRLEEIYGDEAFYVHLLRDQTETAKSFTNRYDGGIIKAYRDGILCGGWRDIEDDPMDICQHYCETVNSNIRRFLENKSRCMKFSLKTAKSDFHRFWRQIDASGDVEAALAEWTRRYNATDASVDPERSTNQTSRASLPIRAFNKVERITRKLPRFLMQA